MATHRKVLGRDLDENLGAGDVVDRVVQLVEHLPNLAEDRFLDFLGRGAQDQVDAQGAEELMLRVSHRVGRLDKACEEHGLGVKKKYIKVSDSKKYFFVRVALTLAETYSGGNEVKIESRTIDELQCCVYLSKIV